MKEISEDNDLYIFECPHCNSVITVLKNQTACCIFRHGAYKENIERLMNPHASKEECDSLVEKELIYGCGKPFKMILPQKKVIVCDYI